MSRSSKYAESLTHALLQAEEDYPECEYTRVEISPGKEFAVLVTFRGENGRLFKVDYEIGDNEVVSKEELRR